MWYLHIHLVCAKLFALLAIKITAHPHSGWLIFRTLRELNMVTPHKKCGSFRRFAG